MDSKIENLIIRSLDQPLSVAEQQLVDNALEQSPAYQQFKADHLLVAQLLVEQKQAASIPFFATHVMHQIKQLSPSLKQESLLDVLASFFPKVTISGIALLTITLLSTYYMQGSVSIDSLLGINDLAFTVNEVSPFIGL